MRLGEVGTLVCKQPWTIDGSSAVSKVVFNDDGSTTLGIDAMFGVAEEHKCSQCHLFVTFKFDPSTITRQISFAANARFIEVYTKEGDEGELRYVKTFRGSPNPSGDADIFSHHVQDPSLRGSVVIKMVSIKPQDSDVCFFVGMELIVRTFKTSTSSTPPTSIASGAVATLPGTHPGPSVPASSSTPQIAPLGLDSALLPMLLGSLSGALAQAQAKLLDQMNDLLDKKLSPVLRRLDAIEVQVSTLANRSTTDPTPPRPASPCA